MKLVNNVTQGDCLEVMQHIPDKSIDMILCDLPYEITYCEWDNKIDLEKLWAQYMRIIKPRGAIVLTATMPFASDLIQSNRKWFRHDWVWKKSYATAGHCAKYKPMRNHEYVLVFGKSGVNYYPQMIKLDKPCAMKAGYGSLSIAGHHKKYNWHNEKTYTHKQPRSVIDAGKKWKYMRGKWHPTSKPVGLFKYLVKTYTKEGDLVLDNCAGGGTTAIACLLTNRKYIVIEKEQKYCDVIVERIRLAKEKLLAKLEVKNKGD